MSDNDEEEISIDGEELSINPRQLKRQFDRIKKALFNNYEELEDDSYRGDLKKEVREIFDRNIVIGHVMDETELELLVNKLITDMVEYIRTQVNGIDSKIATIFSYDFVTQCLEVIYTMEMTDNPEDYDPAYG